MADGVCAATMARGILSVCVPMRQWPAPITGCVTSRRGNFTQLATNTTRTINGFWYKCESSPSTQFVHYSQGCVHHTTPPVYMYVLNRTELFASGTRLAHERDLSQRPVPDALCADRL